MRSKKKWGEQLPPKRRVLGLNSEQRNTVLPFATRGHTLAPLISTPGANGVPCVTKLRKVFMSNGFLSRQWVHLGRSSSPKKFRIRDYVESAYVNLYRRAPASRAL